MKYILSLLLLFTTTVFAVSIPPTAIEKQFLNRSEWLLDPSFELGSGLTISEAGTVTYQTAWGANTVTARSISWNPSVSGTLTFKNYKQSNGTEFTVEANRSGSLRGSCLVNGNDSTHTYTIEIYDATNAALVKAENLIIGDSATWNFQKVQVNVYPTADTKYVMRLQATANEAVIYVDDCTLGFEEGIAAVNVSQVYSAKISSADAVTHENADWINGNCTDADAGEQTCTFTTGFFTQTPNCTVTSDAAIRIATIITASASAITVRTNTDAGAASDAATQISCQKSESNSGFHVRMDQTNFDWMTCPTTTISWVSNTTHTCKWMRQGDNAYFEYVVSTSGAPTAAALTLNLPITIDTAKLSAGNRSIDDGTTLMDGGTNYMGFTAYNSATQVYLTALPTGSSFATYSTVSNTNPFTFGAGDSVIVKFKVPVVGWIGNQNAPLIIGGVTSSYAGSMKTEVAKLNCDAASAITLQYGSWISSIGNVASRQCAVTVAAGIFSAAPICTVIDTQTGVTNNNIVGVFENSATSVTLDCDGHDAADCTAYDVNIQCTGPR